MTFVERRAGESFEQMYRRFKLGVDKGGVLREFKQRSVARSKGEKERRKSEAAQRRREHARRAWKKHLARLNGG